MKDFKNFVEFVSQFDLENCDRHLRLQSELIDMNNIDYIGRFENFNEDLLVILNEIGLENSKISKLNSSNIGSYYKDYYDNDLKNRVGEMYRKDIMKFNYDF